MSMSEQEIKQLKGLSEEEALKRIQNEGYNELPSSKKRGMILIALGVVKEPMFLLLVACGILYLFMGDIQEAAMLLGFVFVVMGITIYQEGKTENALDALRDLSSPRALVIRNGIQHRIAGREVARGDVMILAEGDRIPADSILLWGLNFSVDESVLTGESVPVRKEAGNMDSEMERPGGNETPCIYSGTMVVQGQGVALVKGIGANTEFGRIGKALESVTQEETLLQKETGKIVRAIFVFAIALCAAIVVLYGITRGNWIKGILSGITLAMAMLPEEFPVVLTIFLALGAWRMSQKKVLTRKMTAIETLGAATVLCSDKTGTLTQNRMTIKKIWANKSYYDILDQEQDLPEKFHELIEYGILASQKDPFDPMDKALKNLGDKRLSQTEHLHHNWKLIQQYPLSRELLALSHVWQSPEGQDYMIAAKGAPEAIGDLCHLDPKALEGITEKVCEMASMGLRVLGVARATFTEKKELPEIQHDFNFEFLGLVGLQDPIRSTVPLAVKECYNAGIRVVMITGDYPATAQNIAKQIGLRNTDNIMTGPDLEKLPLDELRERIKTIDIFARVVPEQKLFLVNALKANGEIVAMTGDGVNDAPALKSSHIGVAMGERGTDVAREASDLVLLDDSFTSIVDAVKMGRRIFENLKKAMAYIVSVHIPIAGMSLIPVLMKWDEVLFPVHIVFLELIIDPACSVVFEAEKEDENIMKRNPRSSKEPLFGKKTLTLSVLQGLVSLAVVLAVYRISIMIGQSVDESRTLSFAALIISNLCMILTNRSWSKTIFGLLFVKNQALGWVLGGAVLFLALVIYNPFLQNLFHFKSLHPIDVAIALCSGIITVIWFEIVKLIARIRKFDLLRDGK